MSVTEGFAALENPARYRFEWVACYACGATECEPYLVGEEDLTGKDGRFQYVRCSKCGLCYQNPRIHIDQIHEFYDSEYIAHRKKKNWGILTPPSYNCRFASVPWSSWNRNKVRSSCPASSSAVRRAPTLSSSQTAPRSSLFAARDRTVSR